MYLATVAAVSMTLAACGDDNDSGGSGGGGSSDATSTEPLVIADLEGPAATGGPDFTKGIQIAVDQVNAKGGVDGRKIEVKTFKRANAGRGSRDLPRRRIRRQRGHRLERFRRRHGDRRPGQPREAPAPAVSGRRDLVEPPRPYIYALSWDKEYPSTVVRWAVENKGTKKIAILHYESDYSSGITKSVEDRCKELGCPVDSAQWPRWTRRSTSSSRC